MRMDIDEKYDLLLLVLINSTFACFCPAENKMNSLIKKLVAIAALFALLGPSTHAKRKKGRGGGRLGGGRDKSLFLNMTCDSAAGDKDYSCDLPKGDEEGMFVCRTRYHPVTGAMNKFPMCISSDRAMEGDECGCCDGDETACPQPCGCACELGVGRDGVVREGVFVVFDDVDAEPVCVRTGASMRLVAKSTDDSAVTCLATDSVECMI